MSVRVGAAAELMAFYDIFNGDADGICALHQLRLIIPRDAELVTGIKRDIRLVERVCASAGDELIVLDVSMDTNRAGVRAALEAGARVRQRRPPNFFTISVGCASASKAATGARKSRAWARPFEPMGPSSGRRKGAP